MLIMLLTSRLWFASIKFEKNSRKYRIFRYWIPDQYRSFSPIAFAPTFPSTSCFFCCYHNLIPAVWIKHGMTVSAGTSVIVLAIDLLAMPEAIVNEAFQDDLIIVGVFLLMARHWVSMRR